jgi:hypothetical protein
LCNVHDGRIRFSILNKQKEEENNVLSPQNKCLRKEINGNSKIYHFHFLFHFTDHVHILYLSNSVSKSRITAKLIIKSQINRRCNRFRDYNTSVAIHQNSNFTVTVKQPPSGWQLSMFSSNEGNNCVMSTMVVFVLVYRTNKRKRKIMCCLHRTNVCERK